MVGTRIYWALQWEISSSPSAGENLPWMVMVTAMRGKEVEEPRLLAFPMGPDGCRVLVVDDDPICLRVVGEKLTLSKYKVTVCQHARAALSLLRAKKDEFDLILTDVHMPDMDGFKLLELVGLDLDLPVIMMSADRELTVAAQGLKHGACYYLMKPICVKELSNIWQHAVRRKKDEPKETHKQDRKHKKAIVKEVEHDSFTKIKRKKDEEEVDRDDENEDSAYQRKKRLIWTPHLHAQFLKAIEELEFDKAIPKRIKEIMNVPGLTRQNIASHLQKYRLYIRRLNETNLPTPSGSACSKHIIQPMEPQLTFGVQDQMTHDELSNHCEQMAPQTQWPGNMQDFSMMDDLMCNPALMDGPTNFQQSYLQQLMEELSVGHGTSQNQMRMNHPSVYDESLQMTHQQEDSQLELHSKNQLDNLNMQNIQGQANIDEGFYGLMMNTASGLHGLTVSDPIVEPLNDINMTDIQMGEISNGRAVASANMNDFPNLDFHGFHDAYTMEGAASCGAFANDNQTLEPFAQPVQHNDFTWGYFLRAEDDNSVLSSVMKSPQFCANSPFSPQSDGADIGDSLSSQQQQGAVRFGETDFDLSSFQVDRDNGAQ